MSSSRAEIITFIFSGEEDEVVPQNATRVVVHESTDSIPMRAFFNHPNIIEVICHIGVKRIQKFAFYACRRLRRLIIPGVEAVEAFAFTYCTALVHIECKELQNIEECAFESCESLNHIYLPSAKVVAKRTFSNCTSMANVEFGKSLEIIREGIFYRCTSLERITIPLKEGFITSDDIFQACDNFKCVDLVEGTTLRVIIDSLHLDAWKNDMEQDLDSINQTLSRIDVEDDDKAYSIRIWITRLLRKMSSYEVKHRHLVSEITTALQLTIPNDIMQNYVMPFLELPPPLDTFEEVRGEMQMD